MCYRVLYAFSIFTLFFAGLTHGEERPSILFIYPDDQSNKTLSCYPEAPDCVEIPNIDAVARGGIRFERAYLGAWLWPFGMIANSG